MVHAVRNLQTFGGSCTNLFRPWVLRLPLAPSSTRVITLNDIMLVGPEQNQAKLLSALYWIKNKQTKKKSEVMVLPIHRNQERRRVLLTLCSSQPPSPPRCVLPLPLPAGNPGHDLGGRRIWFPGQEQHSICEALQQHFMREASHFPLLTLDTGGLL